MAEKPDTDSSKAKHPKYTVMVEEATFALKSRQGPTRQAITSYLTEKYNLDAAAAKSYINKALKECMEKKAVSSSTDNLMGHFKLSQTKQEEFKKQDKAVKKAEKKAEKEEQKASEGKVAAKPPKKPTAKGKENDPAKDAGKANEKKGKEPKAAAKGKAKCINFSYHLFLNCVKRYQDYSTNWV